MHSLNILKLLLNSGSAILRSTFLYVCMSVCLAVRLHMKKKSHVQILPNFLSMLPVVLLRRQHMLYTSGFVDYVMFSHGATGQNQKRRVCFVLLAR